MPMTLHGQPRRVQYPSFHDWSGRYTETVERLSPRELGWLCWSYGIKATTKSDPEGDPAGRSETLGGRRPQQGEDAQPRERSEEQSETASTWPERMK